MHSGKRPNRSLPIAWKWWRWWKQMQYVMKIWHVIQYKSSIISWCFYRRTYQWYVLYKIKIKMVNSEKCLCCDQLAPRETTSGKSMCFGSHRCFNRCHRRSAPAKNAQWQKLIARCTAFPWKWWWWWKQIYVFLATAPTGVLTAAKLWSILG